ncbi:hypothetical protein HC762_00555 [bacterium]|nr:hypothetical protein [bacterium]
MTDRLDRIEAILERNAEEIRDCQRLQADNANAIKVLTEHQAQYAEQLRAEVTNLTELINRGRAASSAATGPSHASTTPGNQPRPATTLLDQEALQIGDGQVRKFTANLIDLMTLWYILRRERGWPL